MIKSLGRAENAMYLQQARIDALANNLANVNSVGFKQALLRAVESGPEAAGPGLLRAPAAVGNEPQLMHAVDTRPGQVRATGRDTDVALMGRGYFVVETPDGNRYTRAGSFVVNEQNQLTTPGGRLVLGDGGPIVLGRESFSVAPDGTVNVDGESRGRLQVVDFENASRLEHEGSNMLRPPTDQEPVPVPAAEISVAQGHVEGSNVNAVETLVAMISAQRAFEVQSKVLTTENEMLDKSVNTMSRVGRG